MFTATQGPRLAARTVSRQQPHCPLQKLEQAQAGPQPEVGAEEVESGQEVEGVEGGGGAGQAPAGSTSPTRRCVQRYNGRIKNIYYIVFEASLPIGLIVLL